MSDINNANMVIVFVLNSVALIGGGIKVYLNISRKLDRINYALFNDGTNGVVQQVAELHKNQQRIKTDIAVMKSKVGVQ